MENMKNVGNNGKKRREKSGLRGISRFCALQNLYRSEFFDDHIYLDNRAYNNIDFVNSNKPEELSEAFLTESISLSDMDEKFFKQLFNETKKNLREVDKVIAKNLSKKWSIDRIDPVAKCILRLGITELMFFKETPPNVIFNEYIEIAKAFFETAEVSFINGLLNKVAKSVRI